MKFNEEYFNSKEFQELLDEYEASKKAGEQPFMDADDLVDIADYYNMKAMDDEALEVIDFALQLYPGATLPNVFMARKALLDEDYPQAREYAEQISDKDDPDYHYLVAEIMMAKGDINEADHYLRDYGKTIDADDYQDFVKDCANLYIDYGIGDKAYQWMMRSHGDDSADFKELMSRILYETGRYKEAERLFNQLLDSNPYDATYWKSLYACQFMRKDYANAITSIEYAMAINPDDPDGPLDKAHALFNQGNFEDALKFYKRYSTLDPDDPLGLLQQAICLLYQSDTKQALQLLKQAEQMSLDDTERLAQIYREMAFCYSTQKKPKKAIEMIDKAEQYITDSSELINMMVIRGHLYIENEMFNEALEIWKNAITLSGYAPSIMLRIIVSLYDNNMVAICYYLLDNLYKVMEKEGTIFPEGYAYMALCCHDLGYREQFLQYLKLSLEHDPLETKLVLGFLFPSETNTNDYYEYMTEHLDA